MWISSLIDVVLHWSKPYAVDDAASRARIIDQLLCILAGLRPDRLVRKLTNTWPSKRIINMDWTADNTNRHDLIEELRSVGDIYWTLNTYSQTSFIIDGEETKKRVLNSQRVAEIIEKISIKDRTEIQAEARKILHEMGHQYSVNYIRLMGLILIKTSRKMYEHIWIDLQSVRMLKNLFEETDVPVILMPTHRSYVDFLLISFIAFHYGLPLPLIASGVDFMGMAGVGEVLRKAGAFFIRRTFADNELYRTVFAEYIQHILHQPQPLEFFVEGTRSRSGKSLYPKFGLLQAAVEVYLSGGVPDIMIVPVGITYERTVEEQLIARELLGLPKPRETTSGLFKASQTVLTDNYGLIWFRCGAPISVRDFMSNKVDRAVHNSTPRNKFVVNADESAAVRSLALHVVAQQQKLVEIHDWAILASVVLQKLRTSKETTFSMEEIVEECQKLISALKQIEESSIADANFDKSSVIKCAKLHSNILHVDAKEEILWIQQSHLADMKTLHLMLAHYRNHIVHLVAPVVLYGLCSGKLEEDVVFMKQLFSREFIFPAFSENFTNNLEDLDDFFLEIMEPFLIGYALILHLLQSDLIASGSSFGTLRELMKLIQAEMKKLLDTGSYSAFEILSSDLISNALQAVKCLDGICVQSGQFQINRKIVDNLSLRFLSLLPLKITSQLAELCSSSGFFISMNAKI